MSTAGCTVPNPTSKPNPDSKNNPNPRFNESGLVCKLVSLEKGIKALLYSHSSPAHITPVTLSPDSTPVCKSLNMKCVLNFLHCFTVCIFLSYYIHTYCILFQPPSIGNRYITSST